MGVLSVGLAGLYLEFAIRIGSYMWFGTICAVDGVTGAFVSSWALIAGVVYRIVAIGAYSADRRGFAEFLMVAKFLASAALGIWSNRKIFFDLAHFVKKED